MANTARIDELRKKFDENPRRYFAPLANEYRKSGDLAQAVFILEEYLPQQQGHISGHIVYGQTLFELGRDEEAKRVFETALSLDPENLIALRHLGHISRQAGDFEAARSWYQRLLEADPRDAEIEQLLGSLDSAAQAHEASMAGPTVDSVPPPLPPPSPVAEADETPFMVERIVEHDAPGAPPREATHPLAPPPLPEAVPAAPEGAAAPAEPFEPPPLPPVVAEEPPTPEPEPAHELLDLNDFSFDTPGVEAQPEPVAAEQEPHEPPGEPDEATEFEIPTPTEAEAAWHLPDAATSSEPEASREPEHTQAADPPDAPMGFEPFSGLESHSSEEEPPSQVGGLETYTFESPEAATTDAAEDVSSFYVDGTYSTPTEPVAPAEGFESVEMEFAAEVEEAASSAQPADSAPASATPTAERAAMDDAPLEDAAAVVPPPVVTPPVVTPPVADAETDAFATETMAKLYMSQGHLESALGIYRTLAAKRPDDASIRARIEEIEDRVQRRRREPTPPTAIEATPSAHFTPVASSVVHQPEEISPSARPSGPTIRDFLLGIIRRAGASSGASGSPASNGGTIDALFGAGAALDDDLAAADTLAQAFAPEPEADSDPLRGRPTREASSELSLDSVFRQPTAAHGGDRSSGSFSFDQFFAGERTEDVAAPAAHGEPDDIEQFNAWLNGLKKS